MARRFNPGGDLDRDYFRVVLPSAIPAYPCALAACFARELDDGNFQTIAHFGNPGVDTSRHLIGVPTSGDNFRASSGSSSGTFRSANTVGTLVDQKWYVGLGRFLTATSRFAQRTGAASVANVQSATMSDPSEFIVARKGVVSVTFESFPGWVQWATLWRSGLSDDEGTLLCETPGIDARRISPELIVAHVDLSERKPVIHSPRGSNLVFEIGGDAAWTTYTPYAIPIKRRRIFVPTAGGAVTGDLTATDPSDTAALLGDVVAAGDLAATDPQDVAAIVGDVVASGDLAAIDPADTAAIVGDVVAAGDLTATDPPDVAAIVGDVVATGDLAATDPNDTAAIVGDVVATGDLAATDPPDVAAIEGTALEGGTMAATDPPDLAAIAGDVIAAGDLVSSEGPDVAAIVGDVVAAGDLAASDPPDVAAIEGTQFGPAVGELEATEAPDAAAIAGEVESVLGVADSLARIKAGQVAKAAMLDSHGRFVKPQPGPPLHHVNLEFDDGQRGRIEAADYNRLTRAQKDEIHNSGSLPQELLPS